MLEDLQVENEVLRCRTHMTGDLCVEDVEYGVGAPAAQVEDLGLVRGEKTQRWNPRENECLLRSRAN